MLGAYTGFEQGGIPAMTRGLGLHEFEGPPRLVVYYDKPGVLRTYFKPDPYENGDILNQVDHLLNTQII